MFYKYDTLFKERLSCINDKFLWLVNLLEEKIKCITEQIQRARLDVIARRKLGYRWD